MATDPTDKYNIKDILSNTEEQVGKLLTGGISENLNGRDILNINEIAAIDWGYKYSYMIRIEGFL